MTSPHLREAMRINVTAYRNANRVNSLFGKPRPICLGDPCIPVLLQDLLRVRPLRYVQVALRWRLRFAKRGLRYPSLEHEPRA